MAVTRAGRAPLIFARPSIITAFQEALSYTTTMTTALEEALNDAISSGRFIDTKIVLFSRRDGAGRICKPRALYANSHVLKSVPYFKDREFSLRPSTAYDNSLSQSYSVHFPRQRLRIFPKPTTTNLRRTTAILRIATSKRIQSSRVLASERFRISSPHLSTVLVKKRFLAANTKKRYWQGRSSRFKM